MSERDLETRILGQNEYPIWDNFILKSPQGTVFHLHDYLQIHAEASLSKVIIFGCFEDENLIGGCSLFVKRGREFQMHAESSGPFMPYGGFVLQKQEQKSVRKNEMERKGILDSLCECIEGENYSRISIANSPDFLDIRPFLWRGWEGTVAYSYYINLDNLHYENFSNDVKRMIKKAISSGFYTEISRDPDLHYGLTEKVFQRQSQSTPFNAVFFKKMIDFIEKKNCGNMMVGKDKSGDVVASHLWIWDNKRAYAWSGGSDPAFRDSGANQLSFFNFLLELKNLGMRQINIMHANMQRLSFYAAGYNPVLVPNYVVHKYSRFTNFLRILMK
jgi:hypothetical protein